MSCGLPGLLDLRLHNEHSRLQIAISVCVLSSNAIASEASERNPASAEHATGRCAEGGGGGRRCVGGGGVGWYLSSNVMMQNGQESEGPIFLGFEIACGSQVSFPPLQLRFFCCQCFFFGIQGFDPF